MRWGWGGSELWKLKGHSVTPLDQGHQLPVTTRDTTLTTMSTNQTAPNTETVATSGFLGSHSRKLFALVILKRYRRTGKHQVT
jgi:hypothetical protein